MSYENLRSHYRLTYPMTERPKLLMDYGQYDVENVSEDGLKVFIGEDLAFNIDDSIFACIEFTDGREYKLDGQVVRKHDGFICLHLDSPIPKSVMRAETLGLMYSYPYQ